MTTSTIPDLWPDFPPAAEMPPKSILKQQGFRLGRRTRNAVYGDVRTESSSEGGGEFTHTLVLHAPFLNFDRSVLAVKHELKSYPAEVGLLDSHENVVSDSWRTVTNSGELIEALRQILQSKDMYNLVESLLTHSEVFDETDSEE